MDDRRLESMSDTAQRNARRLAGEAQDAATRAGTYAQARAQDLETKVATFFNRVRAA